MNNIVLYHGSQEIVKNPLFGKSKKYNDYGLGFYCTTDIELGKEWAAKDEKVNGYVNKYVLNVDGLKTLHLNKSGFILNWIALLVANRNFNTKNNLSKAAKEFLIINYLIDLSNYDIIIGYRADDAYFEYAKDFLNNVISLEQLEYAMKLGKLGEQVVLISKKAFDNISFIDSEEVDSSIFYSKRESRNADAKAKYHQSRKNAYNPKDTFIIDIMRGDKK